MWLHGHTLCLTTTISLSPLNLAGLPLHLLVQKLACHAWRARPRKETDHSGLVSGQFNKQGSFHRRLVLSDCKDVYVLLVFIHSVIFMEYHLCTWQHSLKVCQIFLNKWTFRAELLLMGDVQNCILMFRKFSRFKNSGNIAKGNFSPLVLRCYKAFALTIKKILVKFP